MSAIAFSSVPTVSKRCSPPTNFAAADGLSRVFGSSRVRSPPNPLCGLTFHQHCGGCAIPPSADRA